ncbi:2-oxo-3-hexenedioate decarboxylase [Burkholderiaceae bacterium]|nr:2-oxo-3-hexenedioate decarboxylase [Burkholderiaceae bacterium]
MLTPQQILHHNDSGELWPEGSAAGFAALPAAYTAALAVRSLRIARGERPRGYKVGFTNRTIWSRYEVFAPVWGTVWNTTVVDCDGTGRIALEGLCQPRIEPEAVFGFKATPPANASISELFEALDWVAPGFELVQSHMPRWKFVAAQTVADCGLHGRLLVGQRRPIAELATDAEQLHRLLAAARVRLQRNGQLMEEGTGANVLDSPLHALRYFLNELRACPGAADIAAGDVVTTGTWTDAWPVQAGETWTAEYDSVLPTLEVRFE